MGDDDTMPQKQTYIVTIEEHISNRFPVCASDIEEAMEVAESKYRNGEFVVESAPPSCRLMMAQENETNQMTEWVEF